jgi:hypothetical protein
MELRVSIAGCADRGSRRFSGRKKSEYFCGLFGFLCYIPAPLTKQN